MNLREIRAVLGWTPLAATAGPNLMVLKLIPGGRATVVGMARDRAGDDGNDDD